MEDWWLGLMVAMMFCELWRRKQTNIKRRIGEVVISQEEKEKERELSPRL